MNTLQTYADIKIEREGVVAVLTMNRPEKRNALSLAMMRELDAALAAARARTARCARDHSARRGAGVLAPVTICASCSTATSRPTGRSSTPASA